MTQITLEKVQKVGQVILAVIAVVTFIGALWLPAVQVSRNTKDIADLKAQNSILYDVQTDIAVIKQDVEWLREAMRDRPNS